mmetsp:Transcript_2817/g.4635  ORF Transcript_2817/g.4635 Transcript_2817/m.4635 type:complete len:143 (+) Transcript_2817:1451-1879(+)
MNLYKTFQAYACKTEVEDESIGEVIAACPYTSQLRKISRASGGRQRFRDRSFRVICDQYLCIVAMDQRLNVRRVKIYIMDHGPLSESSTIVRKQWWTAAGFTHMYLSSAKTSEHINVTVGLLCRASSLCRNIDSNAEFLSTN